MNGIHHSTQRAETVVSASGKRLPLPSESGAFVVNLCSSTTPVALVEPQDAALKKFRFFVSRRREDGRERFRLHMGYFDTQQDAEQLLELVREIYPGAWAGLAPGRKALERVTATQTVVLPVIATTGITATDATTEIPHLGTDKLGSSAVLPALSLQLDVVPSGSLMAAPVAELCEKIAATQSLDSVRAAIAALEDGAQAPVLSENTLRIDPPALSEREALGLLESPPPAALSREATAAYAVQLRWSSQPIGISELPPLAIFDAYTLYRAKGRHEGRAWHALRLGFFHDLVSANQVASYIQPEFADVSVVPVTAAERGSANDAVAAMPTVATAATAATVPTAATVATRSTAAQEFSLIDDGPQQPPETNKLEWMLTTAEPAKVVAEDVAASAGPAAKPPAKPAVKPVSTLRRPPANLEETLDVLGAGNLKLDTARGELLDASGVRRMRHAADSKPPVRSTLSRLFDRLAERIVGR